MSFNQQPLGICSSSGKQYVHIPTDAGGPVLPLADFHAANSRLPAELARHGVTMSSKKETEALIAAVGELDFFVPSKIAEYPGWTGDFYACHDGTVIGAGETRVHVVFSPSPHLTRSRGSLEGWQEEVAKAVRRHPIAAFALMASFLPAVMRFMPHVANTTFELVGRSNTGKSTVQKLAASVAGPPQSIAPLRDLQGDLDAVRAIGRDFPLVIDHAQGPVITAGKNKKPVLFATVAYGLPLAPGGRIALLSGQRALRDACEIEWSEDNMVTLRLPDTDYGVFASLPDGFCNCADFADHLVGRASAHHGLAFPAFVRVVREDLDRREVEAYLARRQAFFLLYAQKHGLEYNSPRLLRVFAAVYAAGRLAVKCKVLPKGFNTLKSTIEVLRLCAHEERDDTPFAMRLDAFAKGGELVMVGKKPDPEQLKAIGAAIGTLTLKSDCTVLKIAPANIRAAFPDWERIKSTAEVREFLKVDGKNLAAWGSLAPGMPRTRLFQFTLPLVPATEPEPQEPGLLDDVEGDED